MDRSKIPDLAGVIERERVSRQALVQVRQMHREIDGVDPATVPPEVWHKRFLMALDIAESGLEWGLATSKALKGLVAEIEGEGGPEGGRDR